MRALDWILLGVVLSIASAMLLSAYRRRRELAGAAAVPAARPRPVKPSNPFAAVSVQPSLDRPCAAVLELQGQRFLALRAPALPRPGCDQRSCGCRYVRYTDRRGPGDRRDAFGRFRGLRPYTNADRRAAERRAADQAG